MTPRKKILLLAGVAGAGLALVAWQSLRARAPGASLAPPMASRALAHASTKANSIVATDVASGAPNPRATAELVRALYRREQLARELALEQRRYAANYWESDPGGRPAQLARERAALLAELAAEAAQVLRQFFPGGADEVMTLTPFFADAAGPNVAFLSPELRASFEAEILAADDGQACDAERLARIAERVLPARELEAYRQWNDPAAAALRRRLVGFAPTETEFAAILQARQSVSDDDVARSPALETALGGERFAALQKLQDPALHAALGDLHRAGLPLEQAEWLAATRARAVAEIDAIWRSPALPVDLKRERIGTLERSYGEAIAKQLGLHEATLDGLTPES